MKLNKYCLVDARMVRVAAFALGLATAGCSGGSDGSAPDSSVSDGDASAGDASEQEGGPQDAGSQDAGALDADGPDAAAQEAGLPDGALKEGGSPDADLADSGPPDGGSLDGGSPDADPFDGGFPDSGPQDGGSPDAAPFDGGFPDSGPQDGGSPDAAQIVPAEVEYAITKQTESTDPTDPLEIELVSLTNFPYLLSLDSVTPPDGLVIQDAYEFVSARNCPTSSDKCKQRWKIFIRPDTNCDPAGMYDVSFTVGCAPGGDCSKLDPSWTSDSLTFTIDTTRDPFACDGGLQPAFRQFFIEDVVPTERGGQAVITYRTRVNYPYTVTAVGVTEIPENFTLDSFTTVDSCPKLSVGDDCTEDHELTITDDGACSLDGTYKLDVQFGCHPEATAAECDMLDPSWVGFMATYGAELTFDEPDYCTP